MKNENNSKIDHILNEWPFDPFSVNVRMIEDESSRIILQMRVDMGILQLETDGRPDGNKPHGARTYYDFLKRKAEQNREGFALDEDQCVEIDREFVQFYHRRVCWLQLKQFNKAVSDADHTLGLMDFCKQFSPNEEWTISHEQYRPFVLYHRTQAAALAVLDENETPETAELAIAEVNKGLAEMQSLFVEYDAEDQYDEDELVVRLIEFRDGLKNKFNVASALDERLAEAIANEDYEQAAEIRDMIAARDEARLLDDDIDFLDSDDYTGPDIGGSDIT